MGSSHVHLLLLSLLSQAILGVSLVLGSAAAGLVECVLGSLPEFRQ